MNSIFYKVFDQLPCCFSEFSGGSLWSSRPNPQLDAWCTGIRFWSVKSEFRGRKFPPDPRQKQPLELPETRSQHEKVCEKSEVFVLCLAGSRFRFPGPPGPLLNLQIQHMSIFYRIHGIFTYIWLVYMVNVAKFTMHGSYLAKLQYFTKEHCFLRKL